MNKTDSEVKIRPYRKGDEYPITDLFRISSDHFRTVDFFRWANLKNPHSQGISLILEDKNGNIIGHYALMIYRLVYRDKVFKAGFGAQLVIHPLFRNFQLMWKLLNAMWERSGDKGLDFLFAFPNNNIWPIKNRLMEWKLVREFQALELDLKETTASSKSISEIELQRISNLSVHRDVIDKIWQDNKRRYRNLLHIERGYDFVCWRFFQHPLEHYPFFLIKNLKGTITGWIALKFYRKDGKLYGHVLDFIISDEKLEKALISHVIEYFSRWGVNIISVWGNTFLRKKYKEMGFKEMGFTTNFGVKAFDNKLNAWLDITDYNKWDMAMSYSDAF